MDHTDQWPNGLPHGGVGLWTVVDMVVVLVLILVVAKQSKR